MMHFTMLLMMFHMSICLVQFKEMSSHSEGEMKAGTEILYVDQSSSNSSFRKY